MDKEKKRVVNEIKKFKQRLMGKYKVRKLLLFGSYAKNRYNKYSDVDLLIISDDFKKFRVNQRNYPLYFMWGMDKDIDFLCYTSQEADELKKLPTICKTAFEEGIEI